MKKTMKSFIAVLLAIVMILPIAGLTSNKSQASVNYNRTAALNYAAAHWNDRVGQCAQFVSACLTAGGLSVSQTVCLNLWNTLKKYGTPYKLTATSSGNGNIKLSSNTGKVEAGDPLFYVCDTCGGVNDTDSFPHVVICGGTNSSGYLTAYGHNAAWNNKLVWTQFSTGSHAGHNTNIYSIHIDASTSYTLTYNANGGSGAPEKETVTAGDWCGISSTKPTRTGYTFLGWSESSSATSASYTSGTIWLAESNMTLYAVWRKNILNVYYNANGGSISSDDYKLSSNVIYNKSDSTKYFQKWTYNNAKNNGLVNKSTFGIYKDGYTFSGWGTKASGGTIFDPHDNTIVPTDLNSNIKNGDCSVTLYAIWIKNTYTLTYNANNGSNPPSVQTGSTSYTISSTKPTRSGYTFLGWSTSSSATSASYNAGDKITINKNTTLYAVWEENTKPGKTKLTVTPGTDATETKLLAEAVVNGDFYEYNIETYPEGEKVFYRYKSPEYGAVSTILPAGKYRAYVVVYNDLGSTFESTQSDKITFTVEKQTYTLSYNANGGSGAPSSQTGSTSYTISSTVPHRVGYTFLGWSRSSSGSSSTYIGGNTITLSSNTTLYASWMDAKTVNTSSSNLANINFANQVRAYKFIPSSSGTYIFESTGSTDSKIYLYNSSGTELANDDDSGNDRNFKLSYNLNSGSTYYIGVRMYSTGTGDVTFIVAKESSTPTTPTTYTLSYNANGGSGAPSSQSGATSYTISSTKPARSGYAFLGWSKSSSATSASYVAGDTITISANTTLFAVWKKISQGSTNVCPYCNDLFTNESEYNKHLANCDGETDNDNIRVTIRNNPGTRTLNYGDTVRIYADAKNLPAGARIGWFVSDESNITIKVSSDNTYCDITATGSGTVTLEAKAIDAKGKVMTDSQGNQIGDVQKINTKSNIWLIIVSFFKNLFGMNRTTVQFYKSIF